jgi:hypothetical protein
MLDFGGHCLFGRGSTWTSSPKFLPTPLIVLGKNTPCRSGPLYVFDSRATYARTLLPAALASVPFGFVFVRVRVPLGLGPMRRGKWREKGRDSNTAGFGWRDGSGV